MADYCFQLTQEALMSPSQNKSAMQDHIPQWQASSLGISTKQLPDINYS
ncbi:hypothetical protein [Bathymodiolus platifrons methanotrophic gill symbiont]|nr:hypothetical protein [Bathymodiolus platifrons methanotrophic gill symbiont]